MNVRREEGGKRKENMKGSKEGMKALGLLENKQLHIILTDR